MSEPRQSSPLTMFRLTQTQNLGTAGRSNSQGNAGSSSTSFSAQLSSAKEQSRRSMTQPVQKERSSQDKRIDSAGGDHRQVEENNKSSRSTKDITASDRSKLADEAAAARSGQKSTSKSDGADSSTVQKAYADKTENKVTGQSTADVSDVRNTIGTTEAGLAQAELIDGLVMGGVDESVELSTESVNPAMALIEGLAETSTSMIELAGPEAVPARLSALEGQTVTLPTDGLAQTQSSEFFNAEELEDDSTSTRSNLILRESHVGDVISQATLANHYRQLSSGSEKGLNDQSGALPNYKPFIDDQPESQRLAGNQLLLGSGNPLKPVVLHGDQPLETVKFGGRTVSSLQETLQSDEPLESLKDGGRSVNSLPETIFSALKEQARTINATVDQESEMSGSTADLSQRILQVEAQKLASMKEETMLQRNLLTQSTTAMLNVALSETSNGNTSSGSSQTGENMFLSVPGGIVTAPLPAKQSTDGLLTMNAPLNVALTAEDADRALASNIRWMVDGGVKNAVVNVTPSGMGPISVQIGIEKEQMNVSIIAIQGNTREALDSLLPRLREQLIAQGHESVRVDISDGRSEHSRSGNGQPFYNEQNQAFTGSEENNNGLGRGRGDSSTMTENQQLNASDGLRSGDYTQGNTSRYDLYV